MTPIDPFACSLPPFPALCALDGWRYSLALAALRFQPREPQTVPPLDADGTGVDGGSAFSALLADCPSDAPGASQALSVALAEARGYQRRVIALERAQARLLAMCKRMLSFGEVAVRAGLSGFKPHAEDDIVRNHTDLKPLRELIAELDAPVPEPAT